MSYGTQWTGNIPAWFPFQGEEEEDDDEDLFCQPASDMKCQNKRNNTINGGLPEGQNARRAMFSCLKNKRVCHGS